MKSAFLPSWYLFLKEAKHYFTSPLFCVLMAIFLFLCGWSFVGLLELVNAQSTTPVSDMVRGLFSNINTFIVFIAPLISMRFFAEEKKDHTLDLLLLSRLRPWQIIASKYAAGLLVFTSMLALTFIFPLTLKISGLKLPSSFWLGYAGTFLNVMAYLSIGLFASALFTNQFMAATVSFLFFFVFYLLGVSAFNTANFMLAQILSHLSLNVHYDSFVSGVLRSTDLVFYFSLSAFMLYLSHRVLASRRW